VVTVIGVVIIAVILFVIVVVIALAGMGGGAAQADARQLDRRVQSAERQIHEIGQRTREAIIAEARRRQRQGEP
jgi:hypothetical protein